jgi:large subunit ribosomal protein L49
MLSLNRLACGIVKNTEVSSRSFHSSAAALGRPFRRRDGRPVLHAAQRPAEPADIDFSTLGLKYEVKAIPEFTVKRHAWAKQPEVLPKLPFMIDRTEIGMSLPVYTEIKGGSTKKLTIIRKIRGDVEDLAAEVEKVVGRPVLIRPGKIVIDGNYHRRLKVWLTALGF